MKIGSMLLKVILALVVIIGVSSCNKPGSTTVAQSNVDYYTCTMHPSVHSKTPGKCPICSMDLVPVLKKVANDSGAKDNSIEAGKGTPGAMTDNGSMGSMGSMSMPSANQSPGNKPGEFSVPVERQQQIGVTYASAQRRPIQLSIRSVGVLEPDQAKIFEYVARVDGYIQDLKVTSPGQEVNAGEPLVTIYSPDLRSTEQELVNLLNERDRGGSRASLDQVIESSKQRLRQWNVSDQEINALEKSRKAAETLVLRSPFTGVIEDVPMKQGMSVKMGDRLLGVMDLSRLWLWADFYENEVGLLRVGQKLDISLPAFPGKKFEGQIGAIDRRLDSMKRTTRVRVDLDNPQDELRPGMFANVELKIDGGEGLTVPVDAVLPTGARSLVFVDKGSGKLEPRFIRVGRSFTHTDANGEASYDEVLEGLSEGERVVSSANFLIDAESRIQGALKTWDVESETKEQKSPAAPAQGQQTPLGQNAVPAFQSVLGAYDRIHESLAKDRLDGIAAQAVALRGAIRQLISSTPELMKEEGYRNALAKLRRAAEGFDARNLEDARAQFGFFSAELISFLKGYPALVDHPIYTITCPMWKESPAQWVQTTGQVKNPFLGKQMPDCGQVSGPPQALK
jgi:Cu(I)/Ag(I) efflux system membrane fusion protein